MDESNKKMYFDVFQFNWNTHLPLCNVRDESAYWKCLVSKYFPQGLHRNQPKTHNWGSMSIQWQRESSIGPSYFDVAWGIQKPRRLRKLVSGATYNKGLSSKKNKRKDSKGISEILSVIDTVFMKRPPLLLHMWKMQFFSVCQGTIKDAN